MTPIRIGGPAVEPVTTAAMRAYLRLDGEAEEALVGTLVTAARVAVEDATRRVLIESRWRLVLPSWPSSPMWVPLTPLMSIAAIAALDGSAEVALATGLVTIDADEPARLSFGSIPAAAVARRIAIEMVAGYGSAAATIPPPLVHAVRLLAAHWFENRGDDPAAPAQGALPGPVLALLASYRRARL